MTDGLINNLISDYAEIKRRGELRPGKEYPDVHIKLNSILASLEEGGNEAGVLHAERVLKPYATFNAMGLDFVIHLALKVGKLEIASVEDKTNYRERNAKIADAIVAGLILTDYREIKVPSGYSPNFWDKAIQKWMTEHIQKIRNSGQYYRLGSSAGKSNSMNPSVWGQYPISNRR